MQRLLSGGRLAVAWTLRLGPSITWNSALLQAIFLDCLSAYCLCEVSPTTLSSCRSACRSASAALFDLQQRTLQHTLLQMP
jgi:hypothetical protein